MNLLKPITGWMNLLLFVPYYFSVGKLITTFFTPWHRYYWKRRQRGLHIDELFYVMVSNLISRGIGMILRTFVLFIGLMATVSVLIIGFPIALIISLFDPDSVIFDQNAFDTIRGFAWDWHYGYTPLTDQFADDLYYQDLEVPVQGRDDEIERISRVLLSDREKNIVISGEPGSGRRALLIHLAHTMSHLRFLYFDWVQYFKGNKEHSEQAAKLEDVLFEVRHAGNVVLILPDIHELVEFTNVFSQYITRTDLHVIGITTPGNYHTKVFPHKSFMKYFVTVDTNPLPKQIILRILAGLAASTKFDEVVSPTILEAIYTASAKLESTEQKHQPEAAIELFNDFIDYIDTAKKHGEYHDDGLQQHLEQFIEERLEIPFGALTGAEKETLKHLDAKLHERIVNQKEAIGEITSALRRRQLQLSSDNKPIGSFLFLGPTGVGKTETAKALADIFFEDEKKLIRFDMAQYQQENQITDLTNELAKTIRETPYAVLLLDEIEKANKSILNLFLSIVDEGYFFDVQRTKVLCNNLIIIGTSNAASEFIREIMTDHRNDTFSLTNLVIEYVLKHSLFSPEFVNRFDAVVVYTPLTEDHLKEIAKMKLLAIQKRLQKKHRKTFTISNHLVEHIVEEGAHPEFGARELDRTIRKLVEDPLAEKLLE